MTGEGLLGCYIRCTWPSSPGWCGWPAAGEDVRADWRQVLLAGHACSASYDMLDSAVPHQAQMQLRQACFCGSVSVQACLTRRPADCTLQVWQPLRFAGVATSPGSSMLHFTSSERLLCHAVLTLMAGLHWHAEG